MTVKPEGELRIDSRTFNRFRALVYERSGISLGEGKEALVCARLGKRMRALGLDDPRAYLQYVLDHEEEGEIVHLLDAISTNFTSFFREPAHFEFLERALKEWVSAGQKRLRIWSAASSTGEEPYTIAMVLREVVGARDLDARILATDISTRVLERARCGVYDKERVKTVPPMLRDRYFDRLPGEDGVRYRVKDRLRDTVLFKRLNLSTPPFPMRGPLDVVFCRNVMIYFDNEVRTRLLNEAYRLLKPGGYLMVGHSESLTGIVSPFRGVMPAVYVKPGDTER